jgi:hypothetical protein
MNCLSRETVPKPPCKDNIYILDLFTFEIYIILINKFSFSNVK